MNKLLKEFLSYIIEARKRTPTTPSKRVVRKVGDVWQAINPKTGQKSKNWSAKGQNRTRSDFPTEKDARDWLAGKRRVAGEKPAAKPSAKKPDTQGYGKDFIGGQGRGIIPQQPSLSSPSTDADITAAQSDLERRITGNPTERKEILKKLLKAIKSRNPKRIQKVLKDYGIEMSKQGKLKAKKLGEKSDEQKLVPDSGGREKEFASKIKAALQSLGVQLPSEQPTTTASTAPTATSKDFQPQAVFPSVEGVEQDKLDVEDITDENGNVIGIRVEGVEITEITEGQEDRIVTALVNAARRRLSEKDPPETPTDEWMQNFERYIRRRIAVTNDNIQYLREARDGQAYQFEGEEGSKQVAEGLRLLVSRHLPPDIHEAANAAIEEMRMAKDPQSFSAAWAKFSALIPRGSPMAKNKKFVVEMVTALSVTAAGGIALVPLSTTFQLADVIALSRSSLTGQVDIDIIIADFGGDLDVTPAASTKFDDGAASVNWQKIFSTRFLKGEHDGVDLSHKLPSLLPIKLGNRGGPETAKSQKEARDRAGLSGVQGDLADLAATEMRDYVFEHTGVFVIDKDGNRRELSPKEQAAYERGEYKQQPGDTLVTAEDEVNEMVASYMKRYGPMVRAYYGFPDEPPPSNDEIIGALSYGTGPGFLECGDGGEHPRLSPSDGQPYSEGQPGKPNYRRWRSWSSLCLINEAIHNRSVDFQCYSTHRYDDTSRIVADGNRTLSKMKVDAYKNKTKDNRKPDTRMNAKTIPASREETVDGNPCNRQPKKSAPKKR